MKFKGEMKTYDKEKNKKPSEIDINNPFDLNNFKKIMQKLLNTVNIHFDNNHPHKKYSTVI